MAQKKQLGQILLEAGAIDEFQLKSALGYQKQWGGRLGKVLVENRFITEDALVQAIHSQTGIPLVDLTREDIPEQVVKMVPVELAENLSLIPVRMEGEVGKPGETLVLAMSDPTNLNAQDEVQFRVGKKIKALLAAEGSISRAIREHYYGEKAYESRQNVFQMNPDEIQFGGSDLSMDEMVVVKGTLESKPGQNQTPPPAEKPPVAGGGQGGSVEFEDPFAELDSLAKGPEPVRESNPFESPPDDNPAAASPAPAEEDELQEVEIVEELPAWEDEPTDESSVTDQPAPLAVTPLEDIGSLPPAPVPPAPLSPAQAPKAAEVPTTPKPVAPKPAKVQDTPGSGAEVAGEQSAFSASGALLGSMGQSADDGPGESAAQSAPAPEPEEEPIQEQDGGIADREETIRLRAIPRPVPAKKPAEPGTFPVTGDATDEVDAEEDPDKEDTITLRKIPVPESKKAETDAEDQPAVVEEKPLEEEFKPDLGAKPSSMEALLSRVGIGSKATEASESKAEPPKPKTEAPKPQAVRPQRQAAKSQEFEDLLGEELVEEVQTLLESIESGEIDEEPPQIAKASHLIATVIRLLLRKEVFSEVELLEELKRR